MTSMSRAANNAQAAAVQAEQDALRKRAARQAVLQLRKEAPPEELVECTVLPMGDGKISMGEHIGGVGTAHYEDGETFKVAVSVAVALYDRGYVNFDGAKQASADARAERARLTAELRAIARRAEEEAANA